MEIKNAKIESTMLGYEDHGIMTFALNIVFDECCHCGIGGYALDIYNKETETRIFTAKGMKAISEILKVVGVNTWEELQGKYIRIKYEGHGTTIHEIGNLMLNKWLNFKYFFM